MWGLAGYVCIQFLTGPHWPQTGKSRELNWYSLIADGWSGCLATPWAMLTPSLAKWSMDFALPSLWVGYKLSLPIKFCWGGGKWVADPHCHFAAMWEEESQIPSGPSWTQVRRGGKKNAVSTCCTLLHSVLLLQMRVWMFNSSLALFNSCQWSDGDGNLERPWLARPCSIFVDTGWSGH